MSGTETRDENSLNRDIGLFGAVSTVVAGTIGAGLFVTLGTASSTTGPSVILVVALSGILAMMIAINYSYFATIFPAAGSAYTFLSRCYDNRFIGFFVSWSKWLGFMAADAVLAIGFGSYLQVFYPSINPAVAGFVLLTVFFLVNLVGTRSYSVVENAIFILLIVSLFVLLVPGSFNVDPADYTPFFTGGLDGLIAAAVPLFYAYIGLAVAGEIGAEVKNPERTLPIAMIGGTLVLIFLYMWTAAVIYGVGGDYTVLADSAQPLATAAQAFLGERATAIVAFGGLMATASSVHAVMLAAIKMPYSWAWDEIFPDWFADVNERWGTPHWSLVTLYIVAGGLTFWSAGLDQAIRIATFSYLIPYFAVSVTVGYVYLRRPELTERAAFDIGRWFYVTVIIGALGSLLLLSVAYQGSLVIYVPWLVIGLIIFAIYWYRGQQADTDVTTILNTLPGVPSEDYNPNVREESGERPAGGDD